MYSWLSEDKSLLNPYKNKLTQKLVWIKKKGVPQHLVIHFESKADKMDYLGLVRVHHECMLQNKSKYATSEGVFIV
jgi:hypothetical protein